MEQPLFFWGKEPQGYFGAGTPLRRLVRSSGLGANHGGGEPSVPGGVLPEVLQANRLRAPANRENGEASSLIKFQGGRRDGFRFFQMKSVKNSHVGLEPDCPESTLERFGGWNSSPGLKEHGRTPWLLEAHLARAVS